MIDDDETPLADPGESTAPAADGDGSEPDGDSESGADSDEELSPEELSPEEQALFASYVFPDPRQRRISAVAFWIMGAAMVVLWLALRSNAVVSVGTLVGGIVLLLAGVWFWAAGWHMNLDQGEALVAATREVGFPVGHASALLGWRGTTARPTWRILLYSAETPPTRRGLVEVDAVTGDVLDSYTGKNVEDW